MPWLLTLESGDTDVCTTDVTSTHVPVFNLIRFVPTVVKESHISNTASLVSVLLILSVSY